MNELARLLLFLGLAGSAVTFLGSAAIWFMEEERRLKRGLRKVLRGEPEALILAKGRGRAAGFRFSAGMMAVAWDSGGWCLIYRVDELVGAELIIDGEVMGRAYRGEPRRLLDHAPAQAGQVTLRLIFDDVRHPDFELELYRAGADPRRNPATAASAIQEANRWLSRAEAILRRPVPARRPVAAPAVRPPPERPAPEPAPGYAIDPPVGGDETDLFEVPPLPSRSSARPAARPEPRPGTAPPWDDPDDDDDDNRLT